MAMRSLISPLRLGFAAAGLFLAGSATAASAVKEVQVYSNDNAEGVELRWSEAAPVSVDEYPAARQVVVTLRGATLTAPANTLDTRESRAIERVRVQQVTLADGTPATRITVTVRDANVKITPRVEDGKLTLLATGLAAAPAAKAVPGEGYVFTNRELENIDGTKYGSPAAPATGAGQSGGSGVNFYVPPDLSAAEKAAQSGSDQGMLRTSEIFEQKVARLEFKDAPLQNILRLIANETNMNLLLSSSDVKGQVTLALNNVTIGDAFEAILKSQNLAYKIERGGIVRIVPRSQVMTSERETTTEAVTINWVSAESVKTALSPFMSENGGQIEVSKESNILILRDVPETMVAIQELIRRVDVPEKQVKMEVRLVDMTERAGRNLGFNTNFSDANNNLNQAVTDIPGTSTGGTTPTPLTTLLPTIGPEAVITEGASGLAGGPSVPDAALLFNYVDRTRIFGEEYDLSFQLSALETRGEATVLANPVIMALNNQKAMVEIKRQEPFLSSQSTAEGSVATVEFKDVGTKIEITPRITNNGFVQMEILPEQNILRGTRSLGLGGSQQREVPLIDERKIQTSVIVRDEQTVALGGLRQFETTMGETGVPFLMRVPVLSWLFKTNGTNMSKTELVLFVTPHIVKDPTPSTYERALYDKIDYNWDLPDYYYDQVTPRDAPGEVHPDIKYK